MDMDRKAAAAACKERKVVAGIFAIRCAASGRSWVGRAPDLATIWNRTTFTLRQGSHPNRALQTAWRERNGDGFVCETLEPLDDDTHPTERAVQARLAHWIAALPAARL